MIKDESADHLHIALNHAGLLACLAQCALQWRLTRGHRAAWHTPGAALVAPRRTVLQENIDVLFAATDHEQPRRPVQPPVLVPAAARNPSVTGIVARPLVVAHF
ncbi:hypothetical protein GCM10010407_00590 [Rarobacter incanus]